jgi:hypothetical protein
VQRSACTTLSLLSNLRLEFMATQIRKQNPRTLREKIRFVRQTFLFCVLFVVAIWGFLNYRADHFTFAWTRPVNVLVVTLVDPATDMSNSQVEYFLHDFLSRTAAPGGNIPGIERWFQEGFSKHSKQGNQALDIALRPPVQVKTPPPLLPTESDSFLARWQKTDGFIGYFEDLNKAHDLLTSSYDATLYLYFYSAHRRSTFQEHHPVATKRQRFGIVFVPLESRTRQFYSALVAHELCHTFGASDKYEGELSVFPDGYAEPGREPRYPQKHAEIMALGIPTGPGTEQRIDGLRDCVVGEKTAREMGWK